MTEITDREVANYLLLLFNDNKQCWEWNAEGQLIRIIGERQAFEKYGAMETNHLYTYSIRGDKD